LNHAIVVQAACQTVVCGMMFLQAVVWLYHPTRYIYLWQLYSTVSIGCCCHWPRI